MATREFIADEIRRVAEQIGRSPGREVFEKETGIQVRDWYGVYWRSWGDALKEAGFQPNVIQQRFSSDQVLLKYAEMVREIGRIPASIDIRMFSRDRPNFPSHTTFKKHYGSKNALLSAFKKLVKENDEFSDLARLIPENITENNYEKEPASNKDEGFVYLLKSGDHYKIGRSSELERRIKQISVSLPEEVTLEHAISTDDPAGIESYWHRRFADKRANGEWFRLTVPDIRAFKRRRFQ